jgi:serine/threonine protein kinase
MESNTVHIVGAWCYPIHLECGSGRDGSIYPVKSYTDWNRWFEQHPDDKDMPDDEWRQTPFVIKIFRDDMEHEWIREGSALKRLQQHRLEGDSQTFDDLACFPTIGDEGCETCDDDSIIRFVVMDRIHGPDLYSLLDDNWTAAEDVMQGIQAQCDDALHALASVRITHGDLAPCNVLLSFRDASDCVVTPNDFDPAEGHSVKLHIVDFAKSHVDTVGADDPGDVYEVLAQLTQAQE